MLKNVVSVKLESAANTACNVVAIPSVAVSGITKHRKERSSAEVKVVKSR